MNLVGRCMRSPLTLSSPSPPRASPPRTSRLTCPCRRHCSTASLLLVWLRPMSARLAGASSSAPPPRDRKEEKTSLSTATTPLPCPHLPTDCSAPSPIIFLFLTSVANGDLDDLGCSSIAFPGNSASPRFSVRRSAPFCFACSLPPSSHFFLLSMLSLPDPYRIDPRF
jgi:hypothetical protein